METIIKHVTDNLGMRIFLIIQERAGYLVNYDYKEDSIHEMCPCCLYDYHREDIMRAVRDVISSGFVDGKIRWCCPPFNETKHWTCGRDYCHINIDDYPPLKKSYFLFSVAKKISIETKECLHKFAAEMGRR